MALLMAIFGVCLAIVIYSVYNLAQKSDKEISWWKWLLIIVWGIILLTTAGFIGTGIGEGEPQAAMRGGAAFIFFLVVSGIVIWRLVFKDERSVATGGKEQLEQ